MIKKILSLFVFIIALQSLFAQPQDSTATLKISLLTCAPGEELYSIFGHSSIRILDLRTGQDIVYNYGTFSFGAPNFYPNFIRGKLDYWLARGTLDNFLREYQYHGRAVLENDFLLTEVEAQAVRKYLRNNIKKENRTYQYDFFFDNCSTRIRDMLESILGNQLQWEETAPEDALTYRDLTDQYLGHSPWSDFGIALILGKPTDNNADVRQQMFLPDFLKSNMATGVITRNGQTTNLLGPTKRILEFPTVTPAVPLWKRPAFLFSILLLIILTGSWFFPNSKFWGVFDFLLIFISGIAGALFLFMWLGTDHKACYQNWNMLWLFPLNTIGAFLLFSKKDFVKKYFTFYTVLVALALLGWFFWPQRFHLSFLPLMLILLTRLAHRFFLNKHLLTAGEK